MAIQGKTYMIFVIGILCFFAIGWWYVEFGGTVREDPDDIAKKEIVYKMYADYKKDFPGVQDISPETALKLLRDDKVVFADTRKPAEMRVSMLPNAVTEAEFESNQQKYTDKTVVAYCTISYRSGKFVEKMMKKGIRIYNLEGGILAWVLEGGNVYDTDGVTRRIHVYGKKWNYPAKGYESVW
jgi:rhodanese-related sulfurtransferase